MRVSKPVIKDVGGQVRYQVSVASDDGSARTLWYSLDRKYRSLVSERTDAAAVALIIPAMRRGEDLELDGALSTELAQHLAGDYQHLLRTLMPNLRRARILPLDVQDGRAQRGNGVATGFSAGVDSFAVLAEHHYGEVHSSFRVSHLLYNNVGSHGPGGERLFQERYQRLLPLTQRIGLPFLAVNSNLQDFYTEKFEQTHTPRNASVALLLQEGLGRLLYASAYAYRQIRLGPSKSSAIADPIALPLLSTGTLRMLSTGSGFTRVEKTLMVAEVADSHDFLDVCAYSGSARNCSRCWKCMRTMLTLEVGDLLGRYEKSFDLDVYRMHRDRYMAAVLVSREPLLVEVRTFARKRGFSFPISSRARVPAVAAAPVFRRQVRLLAPQWLKDQVRRVRQSVTASRYNAQG